MPSSPAAPAERLQPPVSNHCLSVIPPRIFFVLFRVCLPRPAPPATPLGSTPSPLSPCLPHHASLTTLLSPRLSLHASQDLHRVSATSLAHDGVTRFDLAHDVASSCIVGTSSVAMTMSPHLVSLCTPFAFCETRPSPIGVLSHGSSESLCTTPASSYVHHLCSRFLASHRRSMPGGPRRALALNTQLASSSVMQLSSEPLVKRGEGMTDL